MLDVFRTADHAKQIFIPHRPPAAICAKPASRPRKLRLSRQLAEKNIRLSRRENCSLNTKNSLGAYCLFPQVIHQSPRPASPSLVGAVMF